MREVSFGPIANPDGSPTETSLEIMGISRSEYEKNLSDISAVTKAAEKVWGATSPTDAANFLHFLNSVGYFVVPAPEIRHDSVTEPDFEEFDSDDWKILFMLLCENVSKVDFEAGLTTHGKRLLKAVTRKIGINAVGVDIDD